MATIKQENLIFQKLAEIMKEVPVITKGRQTDHGQKYKFRGIDDMYNELHPLFAKHGVFFTSRILNTEREERRSKNDGLLIWAISDIEFTFYAEDGSSVSSVMRGEAMDTSDKASNKAASAALKYALMQLLMIPTEEDNDTENADHKPEPKQDNYEVERAKLQSQYLEILDNTDVFDKDDKKKYAIKNEWTVSQLKACIEKLHNIIQKKKKELVNA